MNKCPECGQARIKEKPKCWNCGSDELEWEDGRVRDYNSAKEPMTFMSVYSCIWCHKRTSVIKVNNSSIWWYY